MGGGSKWNKARDWAVSFSTNVVRTLRVIVVVDRARVEQCFILGSCRSAIVPAAVRTPSSTGFDRMMPLSEAALSVLVAWNALVAEPRELRQQDTVAARPMAVVDTVQAPTTTSPARDSLASPGTSSSASSVPLLRALPEARPTGLGYLVSAREYNRSLGRFYPDTITTADTVRRARPRAIAYSDAYGARLTLHRRLSWAMLPLFALSYFSGDQILENGSDAPAWARNLHRPAATGSALLFGANSITGYWNLWEGRHDPNHRKRRILHAVLFTTASAGFVYAGTQLAEDAEQSQSKRRQHRNVALGSIGVSTGSWLLMLLGN